MSSGQMDVELLSDCVLEKLSLCVAIHIVWLWQLSDTPFSSHNALREGGLRYRAPAKIFKHFSATS